MASRTTGIDLGRPRTTGSAGQQQHFEEEDSLGMMDGMYDEGEEHPSFIESFDDGGEHESQEQESSLDLDSQWGNGGGFNMMDSLLEFSEAEESQAEIQLRELSVAYGETQHEVRDLEKRIQRRTLLVDTLRTAYLKDVVTLKHVLMDVLTSEERRAAVSEYNSRLPSVDLRRPLQLYGPKDAELRVLPCAACGGVVDVTMHDSDAADRMQKAIKKLRAKDEKLRVQLATCDAKLESEAEAHRASNKAHGEEKRYLYGELKKVNAANDKLVSDNVHLSAKVSEFRETVHNQTETIKQLEVKETRLLQVEREQSELKASFGDMTLQLSSAQQDASSFKAKITALETKVLPELRLKITERDVQLASSQQDLAEALVTTTRYRDKAVFLENTMDDKERSIALLENRVLAIQEEAASQKDSTADELEALNALSAKLQDEVRHTNSELRDRENRIVALNALLAGANETIAERDETIKQRDEELMDGAAEMEALEEELAAMKQFLSDTVTAKKTPSRNRRARERTERGQGEGEDDEEVDGVEHPSMKFSWADAAGDEGLPVFGSDLGGAYGANGDAGAGMGVSVGLEAALDFGSSALPLEGAPPGLVPDVAAALPSDSSRRLRAKGGRAGRQKKARRRGEGTEGGENAERADGSEAEGEGWQDGGEGEPERTGEEEDDTTSGGRPPRPAPAPSIVPGVQTFAAAQPSISPDPAFTASFSSSAPASAAASAASAAAAAGKQYELGSAAQAATHTTSQKKVQRHAIPSVENDPDVDLLPPTDLATPGEIMLRDSLLKALAKALGTKQSKRALNAGREVLAGYGRMITNAVRGVWAGVLLSKRGLDFMTKVHTISQGVLTCQREGTDSALIGDVMREIVPIAGATLGSKLTSHWQETCDLSDELITTIAPALDRRGEQESVVFKDYSAYFGTTEGDHAFTLAESTRALAKMTEYSDDRAKALSGLLVSVLRSWCDAKSCEADMPQSLADAREQTRQEMGLVVEQLERDLMLATGKVDSQKEFIKACEAKIDNLTKRVIELSPFPERLLTAEAEIESLRKRIAGMEGVIGGLRDDYARLTQLHEESMLKVLTLTETHTHLQAAISLEAARALQFESSLYAERATTEQLATTLTAIEVKETARVSLASTHATQTETFNGHAETQTDFLVVPMSLRTVVARGAGLYARDRPFGVTIAEPNFANTPLDILASPGFQAISKSFASQSRRRQDEGRTSTTAASRAASRTINAKGEVEIRVSFAPSTTGGGGGSQRGSSGGRSRHQNDASTTASDAPSHWDASGPASNDSSYGYDISDDLTEYSGYARGDRSLERYTPNASRASLPEDDEGGPLLSSRRSALEVAIPLTEMLLRNPSSSSLNSEGNFSMGSGPGPGPGPGEGGGRASAPGSAGSRVNVSSASVLLPGSRGSGVGMASKWGEDDLSMGSDEGRSWVGTGTGAGAGATSQYSQYSQFSQYSQHHSQPSLPRSRRPSQAQSPQDILDEAVRSQPRKPIPTVLLSSLGLTNARTQAALRSAMDTGLSPAGPPRHAAGAAEERGARRPDQPPGVPRARAGVGASLVGDFGTVGTGVLAAMQKGFQKTGSKV